MTNKKVLLMDDDPFLLKVMSERVARSGFDVVPTKTTDEALEAATREKPDLIVLDMIVAGKSGFDVLSSLALAERHAPPIMIVSNLSAPAEIARAKELGAAEYMVKSDVSLEDIVTRIKARLTV
jgi:DNA-binding response OmpR family regulator